MHLMWKATSLDLNTPNVDYLCLDSLWAMCLQPNGKKIQMTQEIFTIIMDDAKTFCLGFLLSTIFRCFI
jgi:hypothetical protein